ncbi:MAG: Asp-tRNA(Asn)/Glu-tRNA(Gln) amidotransferase subunit GatA [Proteobacteria bacterium]|nr:Asp-tRNA(Asn)/Glu-tRNA(Gln) amidotransferase subunit GatA [Pseudomonadota bacterium]
MSDLRPFSLSAAEISQRVHAGDISIREVADFYVQRTEAYASKLNTHLYWNASNIAAQVKDQDSKLKSGLKLPLAGVPVLIKDNICTRGVPTTCASKMLENFRPPYDAHVVERLVAAGALIFGKTNCDEFAMGSTSENSAYGPVRNPWNIDYVPGGSSGGSAAAVAADLAPVALGTDTGGSIRQPAAFCGIYGLKPTYGTVSRYGLIAYGSSLDQIGPFARTVADTALLFDVISGHDRRDSTSRAIPPFQTRNGLGTADISLEGKRIGIVKEFFSAGLDEPTRQALSKAVDVYKDLGAEIKEVSLPSLKYSISAYYLIATAEASANLARFDGIRYGQRQEEAGATLRDVYQQTRSHGFGTEVKQRIMLGTFVLSAGYYDAYYAKATAARRLISTEFTSAFANVDWLISPTSPTTAFRLGEKIEDPLAMYLSDICTLAVNLAGLPALSVPCGWDEKGLPIGMQLIGPPLSEEALLKGALAYEQTAKHIGSRIPQF